MVGMPQPGAFGDLSGTAYRWLQEMLSTTNALGTGKASITQTWEQSFFIEYPEAKSYTVVVNASVARTITSVTTVSTAGTATLTVKIGTTPLGGTANAVSTSESTQSHEDDNALATGDDLVLTFSSVTGAEGVSVTLAGSVTLA